MCIEKAYRLVLLYEREGKRCREKMHKVDSSTTESHTRFNDTGGRTYNGDEARDESDVEMSSGREVDLVLMLVYVNGDSDHEDAPHHHIQNLEHYIADKILRDILSSSSFALEPAPKKMTQRYKLNLGTSFSPPMESYAAISTGMAVQGARGYPSIVNVYPIE
ncbi:hypothetical protein EVAR_34113_1 [Eumeta japonica]|uniref:Uncharacterized protein n=1 Tax=Eumeta variegata TaxID=151549 RepID=A0A4C1WMH8_EUMVA|nr:hypothetical protein EVAR_34113_1 [Eumeta japonica]